jgi:hypothetical protein
VIAQLDVPFADVSAAALRYSLEPDRHPPLARRRVSIGPYRVELCVLGSSHQAIVSGGGDALHETLACLPQDAGDGRPGHFEAALGAARYTFESAVERPGPAAVHARALALGDELAGDPRAVVAVFPGAPGAMTALAARPHGAGVEWTTHHLYPQAGEIVTSRSRMVPR